MGTPDPNGVEDNMGYGGPGGGPRAGGAPQGRWENGEGPEGF